MLGLASSVSSFPLFLKSPSVTLRISLSYSSRASLDGSRLSDIVGIEVVGLAVGEFQESF